MILYYCYFYNRPEYHLTYHYTINRDITNELEVLTINYFHLSLLGCACFSFYFKYEQSFLLCQFQSLGLKACFNYN